MTKFQTQAAELLRAIEGELEAAEDRRDAARLTIESAEKDIERLSAAATGVRALGPFADAPTTPAAAPVQAESTRQESPAPARKTADDRPRSQPRSQLCDELRDLVRSNPGHTVQTVAKMYCMQTGDSSHENMGRVTKRLFDMVRRNRLFRNPDGQLSVEGE